MPSTIQANMHGMDVQELIETEREGHFATSERLRRIESILDDAIRRITDLEGVVSEMLSGDTTVSEISFCSASTAPRYVAQRSSHT